ncbi:hypothetical protein B484DRAFT_432486, partial [Ochromonadaceae sp. CCMP2298]
MDLCSNCDTATASHTCQQCAAPNDFCLECKTLHTKLKAFRHHSFTALTSEAARSCCNCESAEAKFLCRQCPEGERFLCLGCSLIHPKVRAFRGHALVPISPSVGVGVVWPTSLEGLGELCLERVMGAYDTLTRGDLSPLFWRTLCVSLLASVTYYFIVRVVFGKY